MLDGNKKMCEETADSRIKDLNWRKCNKNILFDRYCEEETRNPELASAYVAAILVRYWHTIGSNVYRGKGMCSAEECFDWLLDSLLYTLEHKAWRDPSKTVYGDPNGPDKCLNLKLSCTRKVFYLYSNSMKRKDSFNNQVSLDGLMEVCGDAELAKIADSAAVEMITESDPVVFELVVDEFNHKNYMASFIIDGLVNADVFKVSQKKDGFYSEFSKNKLTRHINTIDDAYVKFFAKRYRLSEPDVQVAADSCKQLKSSNIKKVLESTFNKLRSVLAEN